MRLNTDAQVVAMSALLADDAAAWFHSLPPIATYAEFEQTFLRRWGDPLEEENARRALARLEQKGPVKKYMEEFRRLAQLIPDLSESDMYYTYKRGLSDILQRDLRAMKVSSFAEAVSTAEELDEIDRQRTRGRDGRGNHSKAHDGPTPMELGAVKTKRHEALRDRLPKDAKKKEKKSKTTTITKDNCSDFAVFPSLTDALRDFLKEHNACLYCRELDADHMSRDCPRKKERQDGRRASSKN
jgi:hypothetical protein